MIKFMKTFVYFLRNICDYYKSFLPPKKTLCQIEEFDLQKKEVVIICYGLRIISIKSPISEVIGDPSIIINLPSEHACWLGYYYGRLCSQVKSTSHFHISGGSFLLAFTRGRFKISSFDSRQNLMSYVDVKTNKVYQESPLTIAQNINIVDQFDPSQACYVGILAGIMVAKHGEKIIEINKKAIFTLIKS